MIVCPYKEMKHLRSFPCTREERGGWMYCSFCGQKTRKEILVDPIDALISFFVFMLIIALMANSLGSRASSPQPINTNWDQVDSL
ncbi:hypothetical protein VB834_02095 [Limnoraphis robusta Tam1]|uniref:hypothetical protein n=1 Tax=Limnoraphis robusta TaxID=1118279 RepID=UPI002B213AFC|nr:hypothetical protein [Limnoraphis robusta]MEA5537815.1 hypothetical protein [Limnoraphis robusta Tam1]